MMKYPILVLVLALGCNSADSAAGGSGEAGPGLDAPLEELLDTASSTVDSLDDIVDPVLSDSLDADPDGSEAGTKADAVDSDDCVQVIYPDVKVYPGDIQGSSTYRPCLCYPTGVACYMYGDDSTQPLYGPIPSNECPVDEVCSGWITEAEVTTGYCMKPCYHPSAGSKNSGLGCAPGEYCKLEVLSTSETQAIRAGFCWTIPEPVVSASDCPEEPYCKPGTPDCPE